MMNIIVDDQTIISDQKDYLKEFLEQNWFRLASLANLFTEIRKNRTIKIKKNWNFWMQFPWWLSWKVWLDKEETAEVINIDISNVINDLQWLLIWMLNINKSYIYNIKI